MLTLSRSRWRRVTRGSPCPVCGSDHWCGVSEDGKVAVCMRTESCRPTRNGGWMHVLDAEDPAGKRRRPPPPPPQPEPPRINADGIWRRWLADTTERRVCDLAAALGVSTASLGLLGAAWAPPHRAWAFPMRDGYGTVVGIRLRAEDGRKWAVRGSRAGLFHPDTETRGGRLVVCEGPTDTAAAITLGFRAVGRPSCLGGTEALKMVVRRLWITEVVVLADNDGPGMRGAERLALELGRPCRIVVPPCKDIREWLRRGATRAALDSLIGNASLLTARRD